MMSQEEEEDSSATTKPGESGNNNNNNNNNNKEDRCYSVTANRFSNNANENENNTKTTTATATTTTTETTTESVQVPTLAFGLYKVPNGDEGVEIISDAILCAGYRHLDSASIYGNEKTLGRALAAIGCCNSKSNSRSNSRSNSSSNNSRSNSRSYSRSNNKNIQLDRSELFVASKVWNDAQKGGRSAVRKSVEQSLEDLGGLEYLDICYVHWPVPGYFVETYRELLLLQKEGTIKFLGISNFRICDYKELMAKIPNDEFVPPLIHQFEISPFMYRPKTIDYFLQQQNMLVAASKALNRMTAGVGLDDSEQQQQQHGGGGGGAVVVKDIATSHSVTPAQVMLRWSVQKGLVVLSKTTSLSRMIENRALFGFGFSLSPQEMDRLDGITTKEVVVARETLEATRRMS
jgi:diketogulonate reductase-like aldo/keto reductase